MRFAVRITYTNVHARQYMLFENDFHCHFDPLNAAQQNLPASPDLHGASIYVTVSGHACEADEVVGWGEEGVAFRHDDKPGFAAFVKAVIDVDVTKPPAAVADLKNLPVPPSEAPQELRSCLKAVVGADYVTESTLDRVVHSYGKGLRDLVRVRRGDVGRVPDLVVYPCSEAEVVGVVTAALTANAVVIPFGGGTNIAGSLEAPRSEKRPVISVDLGRMGTVVEVDEVARLARVQAGALGPDIERDLNGRGWTLGHFPDSFNYSTLGGWIATRSSGMQSDKYGDIADLTRAVRVVTPAGVLATRPVPSASTGPSVKEMILGSEGRLGIITEAIVHVHRIPQKRQIHAYLFPDWKQGLKAMRAIAESDAAPSVTRVSDANETRFYFATKKHEKLAGRMKSALSKFFLQRLKGFDVHQICLSFIGYEGSEKHVRIQKRLVDEIVSRHGGMYAGEGPGALYDQKKFDTPYIRDFLLDRGALADVSETSAPWSELEMLHEGVVIRANKAFHQINVKGYIMSHMAHSYHSGACLYFTFAFRPSDESRDLEQYDVVKRAIQQGFVDLGGTLSHHHAVGIEHAPWLSQDISPVGVTMIRSLLNGVDPGHNLNPGKIV
jgi:alkyldihydroxyacetonephosphate synthase